MPLALAAFFLGCDSRQEPAYSAGRGASAPQYEIERGRGFQNNSPRQRQAAFLNRIREADPRFSTIERAVLNEHNELGLILNRSVQLDSIPALMRTMLTEMAREFPGQDLNVVAYAPTQPPAKIGTAHLDARTGRMTYHPAR